MRLIVLIITLNSAITFAQFSVTFLSGYDPKEMALYNTSPEDGNNAYWDKGITFGIGIEHKLSENLQIGALFHHTKFSFARYEDSGFHIPEILFKGAEGSGSILRRTSIEVRFFPYPENKLRFYFLTGIGNLYEELGSIRVQFSGMIENNSQTTIIKPRKISRFVHSLGAGLRITLPANLHADISGLYYSDYLDRFQTFLGLGLGYSFTK